MYVYINTSLSLYIYIYVYIYIYMYYYCDLKQPNAVVQTNHNKASRKTRTILALARYS